MLVLRWCRVTYPNSSCSRWRCAAVGTDCGMNCCAGSLRDLMGMAEVMTVWFEISPACLRASRDGVWARPAGVVALSVTMKSSRFINSACDMFCSDVFRSCAMPLGTLSEGAEGRCWALEWSVVSHPVENKKRDDTQSHRDEKSIPTYRARCSSSLRLRKFMCIIRHVRFSIRSWFGSICFVLLKKRQTWAASGSCFCNSSGVWCESSSKMPFWKGGNTADCNPSCSPECETVKSNLSSWRSARRSPALALLLLDGDEPSLSALRGPDRGSTGRRGNRKSCSVDVGFMEDAGLRVVMDDMVLVAIVSARCPTTTELSELKASRCFVLCALGWTGPGNW